MRIDPDKNKVVDRSPLAVGATAVTTGFGSVWVTNNYGGLVQRVDPSSGELTATIQTGDGPRWISGGEGAVWVANQGSGDIARIDPAEDESVAVIDIGGSFVGGPRDGFGLRLVGGR